jgi:hypothetical protein
MHMDMDMKYDYVHGPCLRSTHQLVCFVYHPIISEYCIIATDLSDVHYYYPSISLLAAKIGHNWASVHQPPWIDTWRRGREDLQSKENVGRSCNGHRRGRYSSSVRCQVDSRGSTHALRSVSMHPEVLRGPKSISH